MKIYLTLKKTLNLKKCEMKYMTLRKSLQKILNSTEMRCLKYFRLNIDYLYRANKIAVCS